MIFLFETDEARFAFYKGVRVFSKKDYSPEAIEDLKAFDKTPEERGLKRLVFVD